MSVASGSRRTVGSFLLIVPLFGSAFPAIKVGIEYVPPLLLAAGRYYLSAVLVLGYLSVFASGVGFVVYFELLERGGALEVNLVTYLNPVVALALDWAFLDEPVVARALVGLLVVFVGFVLMKNRELAKYRGAIR